MKKHVWLLATFYFLLSWAKAQDSLNIVGDEINDLALTESQLEAAENAIIELDELRNYYRQHPINLNEEDDAALNALAILTPIQIYSLNQYKKCVGALADLYEIQAIPGWNIDVIDRIKNYIIVKDKSSSLRLFRQKIFEGQQQLLIRAFRVVEQSKGYATIDTENGKLNYPGSSMGTSIKYTNQFSSHLGFGFVADKDPGEYFFKKGSRPIDFISAHCWIKDFKKIKTLILGNYNTNIGQGLISWQGFSFGGLYEPALFKKSAAVIERYQSYAETGFNSGAAIELSSKKTVFDCWFSRRKLDVRIDSSLNQEELIITSFLSTGLHRTIAELNNRKNAVLTDVGGSVKHRFNRGAIGINFQFSELNHPLEKGKEVYNVFDFEGQKMMNTSVDFGYNMLNVHWFGEYALDKDFNHALVVGGIRSLSKNADLAIRFQSIQLKYASPSIVGLNQFQSLSNGSVVQMLFSIQPIQSWKVCFRMESTQMPWLTYLRDAPSNQMGYVIRFSKEKAKQTVFIFQYSYKNDHINNLIENEHIYTLASVSHSVIKTQQRVSFSKQLSIINQLVLSMNNKQLKRPASRGFSIGSSFQIQNFKKTIKGGINFFYFNTDNYDSRIFVQERNTGSSASNSILYGKGCRYSIFFDGKLNSRIDFSCKGSKILLFGVHDIGQGFDLINGNTKAIISAQLRIQMK